MVIVKLDISNVFGSLSARLVFDGLSGKASRDYASCIQVDEEFGSGNLICFLQDVDALSESIQSGSGYSTMYLYSPIIWSTRLAR